MTKSRSHDQAKLKVVCDAVCDNIEAMLDLLNIEYKHAGRMLTMACPVHGGDNMSAVNIYPEGENYRGNWVCRTHGCEKVFKGSVLGFIRGVLSHNKHGWEKTGDQQCTFQDALDFALEFTKQDLKKIKISNAEKEKRLFTNMVGYILPEKAKATTQGVSRDQVRKSLEIPAPYYLNRQYSREVLEKYDIGLCDKPNKEMSARVVVPIYDTDYRFMVGCTGRSIFEKCVRCGAYHDPVATCPADDQKWMFSKWKHNTSFKSQNHLYNFWFAKDHILQSGVAIIVESPGNVWRLEENQIHNSIAIFGSSLSDRQKMLLDSSGAMSLVILTDNDEAGNKAAQQIIEKCQNTYRTFRPKISKNDIGEMTSAEIQIEIKDYIEKHI